MRLFISYARVDKPYCIQIIDTLSAHDVWYDQRLYAGQDWWEEIMRRLEWCQGFVYLLSPEALNSEYCKREFELALSFNKEIFPVRVYKDVKLPDSLKHRHYTDLSRGLTPDAVKNLLDSIYMAERRTESNHRLPVSLTQLSADQTSAPTVSPASVISVASQAMESGQYDRAVFVLRQAKASGYVSKFINIDSVLREAESGLERQSWLREADREYRQIAELVKHRRTRPLGCEALTAFQKDFPDYDPDCLANICAESSAAAANGVSHKIASPQMAVAPNFSLPQLDWVDIPEGMAMIEDVDGAGQAVRRQMFVDRFKISKYPVTNAQYQKFLDDPMGYANLSWWQFSPHAHEYRMANPTSRAGRFKGEERPRENVTWYDAMAFCHWLSTRVGFRVTLPTEAQWQRAAQGDDERRFPWGNAFDVGLCNARESEIKMTTLVVRYPEGASPYGVYDMVGNVWEWCLDTKAEHDTNVEITSSDERAVHGGSYVSVHERSGIGFRYFLAPQTAYASIGFRLVQNT